MLVFSGNYIVLAGETAARESECDISVYYYYCCHNNNDNNVSRIISAP